MRARPTTAAADRIRRRQAGFTLIELMAVLIVLALTFAVVVPNLEGMSPTYSLRGGAREVGGQIELARGESVAKRRSFSIAYQLDEGWHAIVLPPGYGPDSAGAAAATDDSGAGGAGGESGTTTSEPDVPMAQREMLEAEYLPRGVKFKSVILAGGEEQTDGLVYVAFDPFGTEGSHIVHLTNERDEVIAVTFHATAGTISYDNEERAFEEFEGEEQEYRPPQEGPR